MSQYFDSINPTIANTSANTSSTSAQIIPAIAGALVRSQLIITNTSLAAVVTIAKGDVAATQGYGIRLNPGSAYIESTDHGFTCWQGAVQAVSDVAGSVAITVSYQ